jgi:hypothetical protein
MVEKLTKSIFQTALLVGEELEEYTEKVKNIEELKRQGVPLAEILNSFKNTDRKSIVPKEK